VFILGAARFPGWDDTPGCFSRPASRAGIIEPGAAADIVAIAGDPLADIECLQQVQLVIQDGQIAWDRHHHTTDRRAGS